MDPDRSPLFRFFNTDPSQYVGEMENTIKALYQDFAENLDSLPNGAEKTVALRKLLESKDAALRSLQK